MPRFSLLSLLSLALFLPGCSTDTPTIEPAANTTGPTGTDIHLFSLTTDTVTFARMVTDEPGYDNQPYFYGSGPMLLYTSDRSGNMDTFRYDVGDNSTTQVTDTQEGEYSPTIVSGAASRFSAIRMDLDGVQELWQYGLEGTEAPTKVADIDRVGYHTWVGDERILFFRLGQPPTLQLVTAGAADTTVVAERVGRSLHRIPGEEASSYLGTVEAGYREIRRFDWATAETSAIAVPLEGGQDYAWTPDGALLMAIDGILYSYAPGRDVDWREIGDTGLSGTSRIAVSPDGRWLAVVADRE